MDKKEDIFEKLKKWMVQDFEKGESETLLDLVYANFYIAGSFGNQVPTEKGREMTKFFIELIQSKK